MKEIKELLEKCIEADEGTVVSFDCHIPQVTIRLHDSRTMLQYGIQRKKEIGFSLGIAIDKGSKKGKQIIYEFNNKKSLDSFKEFEEDRSKLYVKDFGIAIDEIISTLEEWLAILKRYQLKDEVTLHYTWPIKRYLLQG